MTGPMGSGSADKPRTPKPPTDKPPVPPDAQKSQHDTNHPADKTTQPDGKGGKDNHGPAGPQGGKPADGAPKSVDKTDNRTHDPGSGHAGDGPAKPGDNGGVRVADAPRHGDDHQPGPHVSTNFAEWKASFQAQWQPHPDAAMKPVAPDAKQHGDQKPEGFVNRLDLDGCRTPDGKLDPAKLKAELVRAVKTDISMSLQAHLRTDIGKPPQRDAAGYPHGGHTGREVHTRPIEVTVRVEHAKSNAEVRQVQDVFTEVRKEFKVNGHVESGRPPVEVPEPTPGSGYKPRPEPRPVPHPVRGPEHPQVQRGSHEVHRPQPVPPPRPITPVQPHIRWR
ncbi:hypothetical protein [Kutzneria kofuensis]|uniref:Uncharacterized protein n=1 Tax=Kutzneria kofuensis TaxID=103725 RepID=A0A7W9NLU1_9PSEU|nr:hypothetical protein [Kutzneria kofuensis]MBB5897967.1 hypothetical protein [Kutzneria kofuensis]